MPVFANAVVYIKPPKRRSPKAEPNLSRGNHTFGRDSLVDRLSAFTNKNKIFKERHKVLGASGSRFYLSDPFDLSARNVHLAFEGKTVPYKVKGGHRGLGMVDRISLLLISNMRRELMLRF